LQNSSLLEYFENNTGRTIDKWIHYFDIYERYFHKYQNRPVNILEIGVYHGGSLQMWKHYFGLQAQIFGLDINPWCKSLEEDRIKIFIGDQSDRLFLKSLKEIMPKIDILIDDGGHNMIEQIVTFEELYSHIKDDGIYLAEDLHTSYWTEFGGGYRKRNSFIEYSKDLIDQLNAWHSRDNESFKVTDFTTSANSIHYYDSILIIEKHKRNPPITKKTGKL
jgi:hypothetical protein